MEKKNTLFGEQLHERRRRDNRMMGESLEDIADALRGKERFHPKEHSVENLLREVGRICNYFEAEMPDVPPAVKTVPEIIDYLTAPSGITHRRVELKDNWWKDGEGPLLAELKSNGRLRAILPGLFSGYTYTDDSGNTVRITAKNCNDFALEAVCFYRPLPQEEMDGRGLVRFLARTIPRSDYLQILAASVFITVIGMIPPFATSIIFRRIIPTGSTFLILTIFILLLASAAAVYMISVVRSGLQNRIRQRMSIVCENAVMGRLIHLPAKFFQGKSSGGIAQSMVALRSLPMILTDSVLGPGITAILSVAYVVEILLFAPALALPAFCTVLAQGLAIFFSIRQKNCLVRKELAADMDLHGFVYPLFTGIQRIRLSGSEKRAVALWAERYKHKARAAYNVRYPSLIQNELVTAVSLLGTLWVYASGMRAGISVAQFASFLSAFSIVTANLLSFSQTGLQLAYLRPILGMVEPVLRCTPETTSGMKYVTKLRGEIELNNVSFRYNANDPLVLNGISLKIDPGEYVAIVGRSGCGKSTLLRLLMGFEHPEEGTICYDSINIEDLDPGSLRRNIGSVLQEGKLFAGDIFSNISIAAPWITLDEAWEAAEMAGIADTIRQLPLGMHSLITEGSGGISGGQRQRLMIARAIAAKPQVLMFDEATSALDNITQKIVSDSLDSLNCTRIVIAHRLSTIRNCSRIIVLDQGRIAEDGTYEELIAKKGLFADLVARQHVTAPA